MASERKYARLAGSSPVIALAAFNAFLVTVTSTDWGPGTYFELAACISAAFSVAAPLAGAILSCGCLTASAITIGGPGIGAFAPLLPVISLLLNRRTIAAAIISIWVFAGQMAWTSQTLKKDETLGRYAAFWLACLVTSWGIAHLLRAFLELSQKTLAEKMSAQRQTIARDLHDTVAYSLSLIVMRAEESRLRGKADPEDLVFVGQTAERSIRELRGMMELLRSDERDVEAQAIWRPAPVSESLSTETTKLRAQGFQVSLQVEGSLEGLPNSVDDALSKAVHEGANNISRHAEPRSGCAFMIAVNDTDAELVITNIPKKKPGRHGNHSPLGLIGMRERAIALGGEFSAGPGAERWITRISLPSR